MVSITKRSVSALLVLVIPVVALTPLAGSAGPTLGLAQSLAVQSAWKVTHSNSTTRNRDLGVRPGPKSSGFFGAGANESPGRLVTGRTLERDAVAAQAQNEALVAAQTQNEALIAANVLSGRPLISNLTGQDLGGLTLTTRVYSFSSSGQLKGALSHDAQGGPNADFVFQIGKTLTTAPNSTVSVINGGASDGVYWDVGSSAKLDMGTLFAGNILADHCITLATGAQILSGRAEPAGRSEGRSRESAPAPEIGSEQ